MSTAAILHSLYRHKAHGHEAENTKETPSLADLEAGVRACDRWYADHTAATGSSAHREIAS